MKIQCLLKKGMKGWQYFKASQSDTGKEFTMYF